MCQVKVGEWYEGHHFDAAWCVRVLYRNLVQNDGLPYFLFYSAFSHCGKVSSTLESYLIFIIAW